MSDPSFSILPYHGREGEGGQIPGCYLVDTSAILVGPASTVLLGRGWFEEGVGGERGRKRTCFPWMRGREVKPLTSICVEEE